VNKVVCRYGAVRELISDNGKGFIAQLITAVCALTNTKQNFAVSYRHQTSGLTENFNGTLEVMLSMYCDQHQDDWDLSIDQVLFAYRVSVHESTLETPFYLTHGYNPDLPIDTALIVPDALDANGNFREGLQIRLNEAWALARENIRKTQQPQKKPHDKLASDHVFNIGDKVYEYAPKLKKRSAPKLAHLWD